MRPPPPPVGTSMAAATLGGPDICITDNKVELQRMKEWFQKNHWIGMPGERGVGDRLCCLRRLEVRTHGCHPRNVDPRSQRCAAQTTEVRLIIKGYLLIVHSIVLTLKQIHACDTSSTADCIRSTSAAVAAVATDAVSPPCTEEAATLGGPECAIKALCIMSRLTELRRDAT